MYCEIVQVRKLVLVHNISVLLMEMEPGTY